MARGKPGVTLLSGRRRRLTLRLEKDVPAEAFGARQIPDHLRQVAEDDRVLRRETEGRR